MSKAQRIVLGIWIVAILALGLFPPWTQIKRNSSASVRYVGGYTFIFTPPKGVSADGVLTYYEIDYSRLLLLMGIVTGASLGVFALLRKS